MTSATLSQPRSANIAVWILRVVVAALFLFAGFMKLSGQPMMVAEFDTVGLGQWFRSFTGILEVAGAVATLIPAVSALGAVLLLLVDAGAFVAQVAVLHMDWIHPIVIGAFIAALIYLQRDALKARLGL
jgi:putative oxidoreductase